MADHRHEGPGENGTPVPRDMPDQQVREGEDPWDAPSVKDAEGREAEPAEDTPGSEVPDTDEAGTGRQGSPHSASANPEQPVPDESSA